MRRIAIPIAIAMLVSACSGVSTVGTTTPGLFGASLQTFSQCDDLLAYYVAHAVDLVGPYGLPGYGYGPMLEDVAFAPTTTAAAAMTTAAQGEGGYSGTNLQVEGVDEADIVKTDGDRIFMIVDGVLRVALARPGGVEMAGKLQLNGWWPSQMLLFGDRLLLIGQSWGTSPIPMETFAPVPSSAVTRIVGVDVSDPYAPRIDRTLQLDGTYVDSRLVDGVARVAITSNPVGFDWAYPEGSGLRAEQTATQKNREIIRQSTLDNWLPYYVLTDERSGQSSDGRLLDCNAVMVPREFSGLDTLSILTFDLTSGIDEWASAGVVASGSTLYATADHVYVATQRWVDWGVLPEADARSESNGFHTQIHLFDTSEPGNPRYIASGEVDGFLLNQFAMDEYQGILRVASSTAPSGWWWSNQSQSLVSVLRPEGDQLALIGRVDGLGAGEQLHSVRFVDGTGYVVTFRQTDPLYTIDLSDPARPVVAGELKLLGYSAYLHPIGDHLLLGLGQDASQSGRINGTQLSLFDVSDPARPTRVDVVSMHGGSSLAESDHHAFTFWNGLVLAPYESWDEEGYESGVIAVRVSGDRLTFEDVLHATPNVNTTDPWAQVALRTLVIGDTIYTVTQNGIAVHDFHTLSLLGFEQF
jgi:uncharacterized secreted protein with C-terminal beta-propeller domain